MVPTADAVTPPDRDVFVLSRPHGTVRGRGCIGSFTDTAAAAEALRTASVHAVVGAIPFDPVDPAALLVPRSLEHSPSPLDGAPPTSRRITAVADHPAASEHRERVTRAVKHIVDGDVDKVVLARSMDLTVEPAVDVTELLGAFAHGNAEHNAFAVDVGAAGGRDTWLLGASPELLLRKEGRRVTCRPYAGSAPRSADPETDRAAAAALASSAKDRREHAFVVDYLRDRLAPLCDELDVPSAPEVRSTGEIWHLATPIAGTLRDDSVTAFDLALLLSPTPAVCGTPSEAAARLIRKIEGPRGLYAGALGWCDARGDGEWLVTIRCLELSADHHTLRTWAGGGIVAESDPQAELDETTAKLRTVLNALGIERA
ncbi:isochorismate synthase [Gordonia rhizosphera]|uniref:isochorismate synthase n=1 Tax=Gordonia rhizosphera NBRC 16068 TaxID=1108045 RepID=K6UXH1_9ACTN|nr:putative isochorismate synthase [Gordonia rhizosphera NBRC 16068]